MDGNGWTGIDRNLASQNINDFFSKSYVADNSLIHANKNFFESLSKAWASPKAVEFYAKYNAEIVSLINSFRRNVLMIARNVRSATNSMLKAQRENPIDIESSYEEIYFPKDLENKYFSELKSRILVDSRTITGMNKILINNYIVPNYISSFGEAKNHINEIPTDIALYDPNNELSNSFKKIVNDFVNELSISYNNMLNNINEALKTEIDTLELAKSQAVDALSNARV